MNYRKITFFILAGFLALLMFFYLILEGELIEPVAKREILGAKETCLKCHQNIEGFSVFHNPQVIGCASCHLGNPTSEEKEASHNGMTVVPGNIHQAEATCGYSGCHLQLSKNIKTSLMSSGRGIVSVNRFVFGETDSPDGSGNLSELGNSPADSHLRKLCASCHLGKIKEKPAPISELSRGGGCVACHLQYSEPAKAELKIYRKGGALPTSHPALTVKVSDAHCFGCHSRSGRISTNYEGWHETMLTAAEAQEKSQYRELRDGRVFERQLPDVHLERGMACIDCHTWRETMGDGQEHRHAREQVEIRCVDCHRESRPQIAEQSDFDIIDLKIVGMRQWAADSLRFIKAGKSGNPLLNVFLDGENRLIVKGKNSGRIYHPKSPEKICTREISGHRRLSCQSCHTAWAPQCVSCHTEFDPAQPGFDHLAGKETKGRWVEYLGDFYADPPALGVRKFAGKEVIETFVPGMILTINTEKKSSDPPGENYQLFRRLYAPISAHTISAKGRDCQSCHNQPLAMGFGRGELVFTKTGQGRGRWKFNSYYSSHPEDGLPHDAWTGFLQTRSGMVSTRVDARPFNTTEQQRILRVGACLTCHAADSQNIRIIYSDFKKALVQMKTNCLLPGFN